MADNVKIAFEGIRNAAAILSAFPYDKAAASLREQINAAWDHDPTSMMECAMKEDFDLKLRLLDTAAAFVREWEEVRELAMEDDTDENSNQP